MITVSNKGIYIESSNFWNSEYAKRGLFFLTGNAGAWRLMVPDCQLGHLKEMATASFVEIERCNARGGSALAIWFEDGSARPFQLLLDWRQTDRLVRPTTKKQPLLVYTRHGLQQEHVIRKII